MSYNPNRAVWTAGAQLLVVLPLLLAGCGKAGPPIPPFRALPAPTKDLLVRQRGTHVVLSFHYPATTPGGQALGGVSKVEVYQAEDLRPFCCAEISAE